MAEMTATDERRLSAWRLWLRTHGFTAEEARKLAYLRWLVESGRVTR